MYLWLGKNGHNKNYHRKIIDDLNRLKTDLIIAFSILLFNSSGHYECYYCVQLLANNRKRKKSEHSSGQVTQMTWGFRNETLAGKYPYNTTVVAFAVTWKIIITII